LAFVSLALITAVIVSIVILSVTIICIFIARGVTAIIVVNVFTLIVGDAFRAVVVVESHFFLGVRIISQRFLVRFGSEGVRRLHSARHSENAE
jgi:hypothetical protein